LCLVVCVTVGKRFLAKVKLDKEALAQANAKLA
jgi:hypothetical protein